MKRSIVAMFTMFACAIGLVWLASRLLSFGDCVDKILTQGSSPDKRHTASVIERNCGATTDFTTLVQVTPARPSTFAKPADVLVLKGRHPATVNWVGETSLVIAFDAPGAAVARRETHFDGVEIRYTAAP